MRLLGPLNMFHLRIGEFKAALHYARRCSAIAANASRIRSATTLAHSHSGDFASPERRSQRRSRRNSRRRVVEGPDFQRTTTIYLGFDGRSLAGAILARTLWLQGHPAQAVERARQTVKDAARDGPFVDAGDRLDLGRLRVPLDWRSRERRRAHRLARSRAPNPIPWRPILRSATDFKAELAIRRGDAKGGVESLRRQLSRSSTRMPYELLSTSLNIRSFKGSARLGRFAEAMALVDETIALVEHQRRRLLHAGVAAGEGRAFFSRCLSQARRSGNVLHAVA